MHDIQRTSWTFSDKDIGNENVTLPKIHQELNSIISNDLCWYLLEK